MALPSGWCSAGIVKSITISFTLEFRAQTMTTFPGAHVDHLEFHTRDAPGAVFLNDTGLWDGTGNPGGRWDALEVAMFDTFTGTTTVLSGITGASAAGGDPGWLPAIPIVKTWTNLRLGVSIIDGVLSYIWFAESGSTYTLTVNGSAVYTLSGPVSPAFATTSRGGAGAGYQGQGPILNFQVGNIDTNFVAATGQSFYEHARFGSFVGDGVALTPPYAVSYKIPAAAGTTDFTFDGLSHSFGAPYRFILDLDCDETSGAAVAANTTHATAGLNTCPAADTVQVDFFDGSGYSSAEEGHPVQPASLTDPWLSAQTIRPYTADLPFRHEGQSPRTPGAATPTDYSTGSITIASPLSVLQSATAWTSDLGTVAIGGTPTVPVFTVTAEPVRVIRNLAESWRDWNTVGHPDYQPTDGYVTTKRDYYASGASDDRWAWSLYSLLDIDMTVPVGAATDLSVTIVWAIVRGSSGSVIDTIETTYSLDSAGNPLSFPAGARNTRRIDLMFPVEIDSRPYYGERVDQIRLLGLRTGVTTLHSISLVAAEQAYITLSGRRSPYASGNPAGAFQGIVVALDGSAPALLWGRDSPVPSPDNGDLDGDGIVDYIGDHQNGLFILNGVTQEHPGKAPAMSQLTLQASIEELHRMEGITATYDAAPITAAFTDADGNVLGLSRASGVLLPATVTRGADWFVPTLPADRITAGVAYDVRAQVVVSGVVVPAGVAPADLRVFQRQHLGAVLEGLATDASYNRHGAGVTVTARGYTGGAPAAGDTSLGSDTTDASGYAIVPVRTGTIGGAQYSGYLS